MEDTTENKPILFDIKDIDVTQVLNSLTNNIYCMDLEGRIVWCNEQQAKLFHLPNKEALIGKNIFDVAKMQHWDPEVALAIHANDQQVIKLKKTIITEETPIINGKPKVFLSHKNPLFNKDGDVIGIIGIGVDITEEKQNTLLKFEREQIENTMQHMHLLAASMAHELRTPLAGLKAGVEGLQRFTPCLIDAYQQAVDANLTLQMELTNQQLNLIPKAINNMQNQIGHSLMFLEISLANLGQRVINTDSLKTCSMKQTIEESIAEYPFQGGERELIDWQTHLDFHYHGDISLTKHILFNLIKNAVYYVRAARKGSITIQLKTGSSFNQLIFKDTGTGIPAHIFPHIFEPFYSHKDFSTGVGLAYCKMIMNTYGGDITCQTKAGEWTEFTLMFPVI